MTTTPRDAIAGLSERLRRNADDCENMERWATPELSPLLTEAATQLDAISASHRDLASRLAAMGQERDTLSRVIEDTANELGCASDNEAILEAIARLRQERDEAYERAASHIEQRAGSIPDRQEIAAEVRRLAS